MQQQIVGQDVGLGGEDLHVLAGQCTGHAGENRPAGASVDSRDELDRVGLFQIVGPSCSGSRGESPQPAKRIGYRLRAIAC